MKGDLAMRKLSLIIGAVLAVCLAQPAAAAATTYYASMSGLNEVPPNASTATGFTTLILNGDMLTVNVTFSGLTGGASSAAHIHCCTSPGSSVGVALPFTGFPSGTSGSYLQTFDLTLAATYTSSFITSFGGGTAAGAEIALINGLNSNLAYSNIHNSVYPGGEIRGFIRAPEPLTLSLFGSGLIGVVALSRRRKAGKA
jgi:hypothetical protein